MPIYSYKCTKCGKHFDLSQSFSDDPVKDCPYCGQKGSVKKTYSDSEVAVIYHGSGYYCTDHPHSGCGCDSCPHKD